MRVQVRDVRLYFDVEGPEYVFEHNTVRQLPTVIAIPGGPGQSHFHHKLIPPVPDGVARVVHFEHRGTGRSYKSSPDRWNLDSWVSDLRALCEALELTESIILGTSFGAIVALAYAQEHPKRLSKLILVSGVARFVLQDMLDVWERIGGSRAREVAERCYLQPDRETVIEFEQVCSPLYTKTQISPQEARPLYNEWFNLALNMQWSREGARTLDLRPNLNRISCPTLVIAGEDDPAAPANASREIAAGIRDDLVTLRVFADCGHNPMVDKRTEALALVKRFIES